jgi:hypothetical protein
MKTISGALVSHHPKQSKSLHAEDVTGFIVAGTDSWDA